MSDPVMDQLTSEYESALNEMTVNFKRAVDIAIGTGNDDLLNRLNKVNDSYTSVLDVSAKIHARTVKRLRGLRERIK